MAGADIQRLTVQTAGGLQALAADGRALDGLRRDAQRDPQGAVRQAAQQFEALFMQMVLKSMREATPKSGLFDSPAEDMYTGMLDQQMATAMAGSGTGLADVIVRQLTRHLPAADGGSAAAAAADPAAASGSTSTAAARAAARYAEVANSATAAATAAGATATAAGTAGAAQRAFVGRHWNAALAAQQATGIPAQYVLGQAALESGWGRGEIRGDDGAPSHNLFGVKAGSSWRGRTVDVVTTEYENGAAKKVTEKFRAYDSYDEAFRDWAQLLTSQPRYAQVLARGRDGGAFAQGLQQAGYATDPAYGAKLTRVIASVDATLHGA